MIYLWTDPVHLSALPAALGEQWRVLTYERPPLAPIFTPDERHTIVNPCRDLLSVVAEQLPTIAGAMPWPVRSTPDAPRFRAIVELDEAAHEVTVSLRIVAAGAAREFAGAGAFRAQGRS